MNAPYAQALLRTFQQLARQALAVLLAQPASTHAQPVYVPIKERWQRQ